MNVFLLNETVKRKKIAFVILQGLNNISPSDCYNHVPSENGHQHVTQPTELIGPTLALR